MKTETLHITDDPAVTLTCYIHDESNELRNANLRPAVLVLPGGGYQFCSDREAEPIALAYMAEGYNTFVLRYTVGLKSLFPTPLHDAQKAMDTIRERSDEWRVNPKKIAVIGFSAGGHLAAALGTIGAGIKPAAMILCYPCITEALGHLLAHPVPGLEHEVDDSTPPTFIFATAADGLVPIEESLAFATALAAAKIPFELHAFQHGAHGLSLAKPLTSNGSAFMSDANAAQWFPLSVAWLKGIVGDFEIV